MPRLRGLLCALLLLCSLPLARSETDFIRGVRGSRAFEAELQKSPLLFVKFFHPGCPHCQAAKKPIDDLAALFHKRNSSLRFIEVDASLRINRPLIEAHVSGLPTLKLFIRGKLVAEYKSARETSLMAAFLTRILRSESAPLFTRIRNRRDLDLFLDIHGNRSFILARGDAAAPELKAEFRHAALRLRAAGTPALAFGAVDHPSLLVPDAADARARFEQFDVYDAAPFAVAARGRAAFDTCPQWWFAGVMGGESLTSFMTVATLPLDGSAQLTPANAPAVSAASRPVLYTFGSRSSPDLTTADELHDLIKGNADDLAVVYAHDLDFLQLRTHLGLEDIADDAKNMPRKTQYVLYRGGNRVGEKLVYDEKAFMNKRLWLNAFFESHGKAPQRFGLPGVVNKLTLRNWDALLNHDGRAVLLLLYDPECGECVRFRKTFAQVAKLLKLSAAKIIVAEYAVSQGPIPKSASFKMPDAFPYVAVILPGEKPRETEPVRKAALIKKFALKVVRSKSQPAISHFAVVEDPRFVLTITHVGIIFIAVGIALSVHRRFYHSRYATLARIRRASTKSV